MNSELPNSQCSIKFVPNLFPPPGLQQPKRNSSESGLAKDHNKRDKSKGMPEVSPTNPCSAPSHCMSDETASCTHHNRGCDLIHGLRSFENGVLPGVQVHPLAVKIGCGAVPAASACSHRMRERFGAIGMRGFGDKRDVHY